MYRSDKRNDSDDSDTEERRNLILEDPADDYEPKKKRATVWSDVTMERQLNIRGSNLNLDKGNRDKKFQRVVRGTETYEVPIEETIPKPNMEKRDIPVVTVTPVTDDPFGEHVDLSAVEEFGVLSSITRDRGNFQRGRGRGRGRGHENRNKSDAMDVSFGDKQKQEKSQKNEHNRGRFRPYWQNRGRGRGFGGQKRPLNDPVKLVHSEYSLEALMNAAFVQGLPLEQLGQEIAQALGEKEPGTVLKIIEAVGEEKALNMFEETREIESKGGMKTQDGCRRRTPGGVFITLFKTDVDVSPEIKDKIFEESKAEFKRNIKQAKRRNFEDKMKEVADLIKKDKEKEEELKPLEEMSCVVFPDVVVQDPNMEA